MSRNIEIKARAFDPETMHVRARELSGGGPELLVQEDVFFRAPAGRLKLRSINGGEHELIAYRRPDAEGTSLSDYRLVPIGDATALREGLAMVLGEEVVVRKERRLYLVGRTRVHMDEVEGLGSFVELEVVLKPGEDLKAGEREAKELAAKLGIRDEDRIAVAYADLLRGLDDQA